MLPQVVVLIVGGTLIGPLTRRIGLERAAWLSAIAVVCGLAVYAALGRFGYGYLAGALILVAARMRVIGVVAGTTVMRGPPANRTTIGAALVDTASELSTGVGVAIAGTLLSAYLPGALAASGWTVAEAARFGTAATVAGLVLSAIAAGLVGAGIAHARNGREPVGGVSA